MIEKHLMKNVISRREIRELLGVSPTTMHERFKELGVEPIEQKVYKQKLLYKITDVEKAFGISLREEQSQEESFLGNDKAIETILKEDEEVKKDGD